MKKISIMIADDHVLIRQGIAALLELQENFEVIASTGENERIVDLAREKRPEILLLDINMEPVNGIDMIKKLRNHSPATKIIGLSMRTQPVYVKKMLRLGARGYVTKNSNQSEMIEAILQVSAGNIFVCREIKNIIADQMLGQEDDAVNINVLSERELQIIRFMKIGHSSKEIAVELDISSKTVEVHRHNILKKLRLKNTVSVIGYLDSFAFDF